MSVSDHDLREEVLRRMSTERLYGELKRRGFPRDKEHSSDNMQMVCCNNPECVECNGPPDYTEEQVEVLNQHHEIESKLGSASIVTRDLIIQLLTRDAHGKAKYGTSLDRTDLSLADWLQHQTEELLDGAGYAQAAKREAEKLLALEAPLRKLIGHLQENPPRIHDPSLRALVDLLQ